MTSIYHLLADFERTRQAERPTGQLTASSVAPICPRQTAYEVQGIPPTDSVEVVTAATVGTMIHEAYATLWQARDPQARIEQRGEHGQADVIRKVSPDSAQMEVRDLKTKGKSAFDWWLDLGGPNDDTWDQLRIYGYDAGLRDDDLLHIDAICRDTGRTMTYTTIYTEADGARAVDRLHALEDECLSKPPEYLPTADRTGEGDYFCERCPWSTACLGKSAAPPPPLQLDDATVEEAAAIHTEAKRLEKQAKQLKAGTKPILNAALPGNYGGYTVSHITKPAQDAYTVPARPATSYPSVKQKQVANKSKATATTK